MSKQLENLLRPITFSFPLDELPESTVQVMQAVQELARRLEQRDRELQVLQTELNTILAQKPDREEMLPTVFKS